MGVARKKFSRDLIIEPPIVKSCIRHWKGRNTMSAPIDVHITCMSLVHNINHYRYPIAYIATPEIIITAKFLYTHLQRKKGTAK